MPFRFRLLDEAGNDLGPFASRRDDWEVGERLVRWHGESLEVIDVLEAEAGDPVGRYLVVRQTT